jgi:hypothetical protein
MNITSWRPDTCGCEIQYSWDPNLEDNRVHTPHEIVKKCSVHTDKNGVEELYNQVLGENVTKNKALDELIKLDNKFGKASDNGELIPDDSKVKWSFNEARELVLELKENTSISKKDIQDSLVLKLNKTIHIK